MGGAPRGVRRGGRTPADRLGLRGRRGSFYGITARYRKDPSAFREDLPKVFSLLAEKEIDPMIARTFPLLEARKAPELLATGVVEGKIVLDGAAA